MNINLEKNNLIELEDYQLEEINGGIAGLIIGCIGIAAICYYFGDHSAR
ncbi:class IIb bacteriocin, lactobin A/cerein 7B family [Parabacteroides gordonii]|uniref:Lactobin A/cerein 7B family class IIb bacteriocin n=1 Tax=Parabacteroides gordonii MS-1 = DSM 23371 TaxID=1203610 RepID=A0A0F5JJS2_9BACT|nr:class IIb bacteriocin, lactobin A/cerein 7B family [Parabacteroides gordonii]KKB57969.1 lactobin A/cerein 7B family class IIb bacteriocin [Parabacteroides gordonii MS-1 = DSM 23371]MCA5582842.1 class IIb bacteriocin, lactobin A/cerein 7B family [Parabacteroides gordonii]RGP17485.1 class IIb bacteriocin, lactobin A/cerein 7B family [Parabacteroides gordonii]